MRILLFIVTMALLPLQGWAADTMALKMAYGHAVAIKSIADDVDNTGAAAKFSSEDPTSPAPCSEHAGMSAQAQGDSPGVHHSVSKNHCTSNSCCQVCHTVVALQETGTVTSLALPQPRYAAEPSRFASVTTALRLKPPIS